MIKPTITIALSFLIIAVFVNCDNDKKLNSNKTVDVTTMATPNGGKLKSAVEGPVRSALGEPEIDLSTFHLEIKGLVDSSFSLSWNEIQAWPAVYSDTMLMYCVEGWEVWGNWKGILIKDLFDKARIKDDGKYILFTSVDGYTTALPLSYLEKYNAILSYQVNDSLLKKYDGFPLRLIAFGKYGYKWAKWVNKLEVINQSQIGYWEKFGYSDRGDVPVNRRRYYEGENAKKLDYEE